MKILTIFLLVFLLSACQSGPFHSGSSSLYDDMGGKEGIANFVDIFIDEIGVNGEIINHFGATSIERFRQKQIEHICIMADGPCEYTGDDMITVHKGMNITEAEFNSTVDTMIEAMKKAGWSLSIRNRLLAKLAPLRHEVIYH